MNRPQTSSNNFSPKTPTQNQNFNNRQKPQNIQTNQQNQNFCTNRNPEKKRVLTSPKPQNFDSCEKKEKQPTKPPKNTKKGFGGILEKFLPQEIYNPKTKKIFGILSAEDLLIIALIFLFSESEEEESRLLVLALIYILISDKFDLSDIFQS